MSVAVHHGDCLEVLRGMEEASVDAVVTDPPYGLEFMGKEWDTPGAFVERRPDRSVRFDKVGGNHNPSNPQDAARTRGVENRPFQDWCEAWAREVYRVLKPGGHLVAFGGQRTWHRLACAVEDAGFEIRDNIQWMHGTASYLLWTFGVGFPKSHNVTAALDGERCMCGLREGASEKASLAARPLLQPDMRRRGQANPPHDEDLPDLRQGLDASQPLSGCEEQDLLARMQLSASRGEEQAREAAGGEIGDATHLPGLRGRVHPSECLVKAHGGADVLASVQRQASRSGVGEARAQGQGGLDNGTSAETRGGQPGLEGRGYLPEPEGELRFGSLREVPAGPAEHGADGRLRDGAPAGDGTLDRAGAEPSRVRSPRRPRSAEQRAHEPRPLAGQSEPQAGRAWPACGRCGKPVVPAGLGTALKPSHEPIVLARKPLACPTVAAQVLATGTGALNVDACRVGMDASDRERLTEWHGKYAGRDYATTAIGTTGHAEKQIRPPHDAGRFPPNLLHDGSPEVLAAFERFGERKAGGAVRGGDHYREAGYEHGIGKRRTIYDSRGDTGTAARFFPALGYGEDELRFFYSGKASRAERDAGCEALPLKPSGGMQGTNDLSLLTGSGNPRNNLNRNTHPTVKPVALMRWLCRLVTPPGGTVLDMFAGSGSTGISCLREGFGCILVEREAEYVEIIRARLAHEARAALGSGSSKQKEERRVRPPAPRGRPAPIPQHDLFAELVA